MGFFNRTRDFLNGFSFSLKKEDNPFLSAALMYLPNFKINESPHRVHAANFSANKTCLYQILYTIIRQK
jgi:hypothetical protein